VELIETALYKFAAHILFAEHGLAPFFAWDRRIKEGNGSQTGAFEFVGEQWEVTLSYRASGLAHPGARLPTGTEFQLDSMREFDLHVESADDPVNEHTFHAHIAPRWQGMRSENGKEIPVPDDIEEGVNVHVKGSKHPVRPMSAADSAGDERCHDSVQLLRDAP